MCNSLRGRNRIFPRCFIADVECRFVASLEPELIAELDFVIMRNHYVECVSQLALIWQRRVRGSRLKGYVDRLLSVVLFFIPSTTTTRTTTVLSKAGCADQRY